MSTIIATFDDEADLESAITALHELGVDDGALTVLGGADHQDIPAPAAGAAVLPGAAPSSRNAGVAVRDDRAPADVLAAVTTQLGDLVERDEQLRHYASALAHGAHLLALRVSSPDAERVIAALNVSGASHVDGA